MAKKNVEEKMVFNDARYAMDIKNNAEEALAKCQSGFKSVLIAQGLWLCCQFLPGLLGNSDLGGVIFLVFFVAAIIMTCIAFTKCGGMKRIMGSLFGISKKIAKFGWFITPFPIDIVTGLVCMMVGCIGLPILCFFYPIITYLINTSSLKKEIKEADEYLKYCDPVPTAEE